MNSSSTYIRNRFGHKGRVWHRPAQTVRTDAERQRDLLLTRKLAGTDEIRANIIANIWLTDPENAETRIADMARDERLKDAEYWIRNSRELLRSSKARH